MNKRRFGAKFDDADRLWVFGLLRSRSPHVEATDINMTGHTDREANMECANAWHSIHTLKQANTSAMSRLLQHQKARVVGEMNMETPSSTDSWDSPTDHRVLPESLDKPPRGGRRQHLPRLVNNGKKCTGIAYQHTKMTQRFYHSVVTSILAIHHSGQDKSSAQYLSSTPFVSTRCAECSAWVILAASDVFVDRQT